MSASKARVEAENQRLRAERDDARRTAYRLAELLQATTTGAWPAQAGPQPDWWWVG